MLAAVQTGVDLASREWPSLPAFAHLRSRERALDPRSGLLVIKDLCPSFDHNLLHDLCHGFHIVEGTQRQKLVAASQKARRPTAILGRTGASTADV